MKTIDILFKDKLSDHSIPVDEKLWLRLKAQRDHKYKRKYGYWIAASITLISVCLVALLTSPTNIKEEITIVRVPSKKLQVENYGKLPEVNITKVTTSMPVTQVKNFIEPKTLDLLPKAKDIAIISLPPKTPLSNVSKNPIEINKTSGSMLAATNTYTVIYKAGEQEETSVFGRILAKAFAFKNGQIDWSLKNAKQEIFEKTKSAIKSNP
jgi:hypothetical protein